MRSSRRWPRPRLLPRLRPFLAVVALAVAGGAWPGPGQAAYQVVADGLVQWEWAVAPDAGELQVMDVAVRDDGWLIVSTGYRFDGFLHAIPPWGGTLGTDTRLGEEPYAFRQLEISGGRLFGLRTDAYAPQGGTGILDEIDPDTGAHVRTVGEYWYQDLAVDPQTGDLVLQSLGAGDDAFPHPVVRVDPDTGGEQEVIADDDPRSDKPLELAFSPDGEILYAGHGTGGQIDVHRRDGTFLYSLQTGASVDDVVTGQPGTCLAGGVVYTRSDGTAWVIRDPSNPLASPDLLAGGGRAPAASYATLDRDGHVLTPRLADVTLVACEPFTPPQPPEPLPPAPPPSPDPPPLEAAAPPGEPPPPPAPPSASSPPPPPPTPSAQAPPPPTPNFAAPAQLSAPSAGIADSPEHQPVLSLSASGRLALGAAAVTAMAFATHAATRPRELEAMFASPDGAPTPSSSPNSSSPNRGAGPYPTGAVTTGKRSLLPQVRSDHRHNGHRRR